MILIEECLKSQFLPSQNDPCAKNDKRFNHLCLDKKHVGLMLLTLLNHTHILEWQMTRLVLIYTKSTYIMLLVYVFKIDAILLPEFGGLPIELFVRKAHYGLFNSLPYG